NRLTVCAAFALTGLPGTQYLLYCVEQAIAVAEHDLVKLLAVRGVDFSRLQSFKIKSDRCDWSFQLVRNCVDKAVVLFIPADFANKEDRVQNKTGNDCYEKRYSKQHQSDLSPVEQYPSDVQRHGKRNQKGSERDEKCD